MEKNLISIIVPVYNVEPYIHRCIDSILAQTYTDFDLILVDDGSSDNSGIICDEYAKRDNRIHVLHCLNGGPSHARNKGIEIVNTKWVVFVDADDYIDCHYIENFFIYDTSNASTQIIQGFHCIGFEDEDKNTLYRGVQYEYNEVCAGGNALYIEKNNLLKHWAVYCKLFSMEIIRNNRLKFEELLWCGEDGLFWHKYLCFVNKIIFIPERGYFYFCPESNYISVSRNGGQKITTDGLLVLATNYKSISQILSAKFRFSSCYTSFLKMLYLNNYYKVLLKAPKISLDQMIILRKIRPTKRDIVWTKRGILYWILNIFPLSLIRKIYQMFLKIDI